MTDEAGEDAPPLLQLGLFTEQGIWSTRIPYQRLDNPKKISTLKMKTLAYQLANPLTTRRRVKLVVQEVRFR